jgi:hypothetical protein
MFTWWDRVLKPEILWVSIPLAGILMVGINSVLAQIHRHRERLAMIEQGLDPDARERSKKTLT